MTTTIRCYIIQPLVVTHYNLWLYDNIPANSIIVYIFEKKMKITDIHIHIIPGVDDGARNEESVEKMLDIAYTDGIRRMICTPHFHGGYVQTSPDEVVKGLDKVKAIANAKYPDMEFYAGNEIYYFENMTEWLDAGKLLTMAGSDYVLVEFSPAVTLREIDSAVRHVLQAGYRPILAHINRYVQLVGNINHVYELIDNGAYIQINTEAIRGDMGFKVKQFTKKLLKTGSVHFIASDAHSSRRRRPELSEEVRYIEKKYGAETMLRIFDENPRKVINNEII